MGNVRKHKSSRMGTPPNPPRQKFRKLELPCLSVARGECCAGYVGQPNTQSVSAALQRLCAVVKVDIKCVDAAQHDVRRNKKIALLRKQARVHCNRELTWH